MHASVDPALIEQLVFNLLDNAHKYGGQERPYPGPVEGRLDRTMISVVDDGPGIPKEDLEKVFEKFYRVRDGDGRPAGTGLGLAICRAIAQAMGGTIRAESPVAAGRGSRFVVELPSRRRLFMNRPRILVVDDEPQIIRFLKPALSCCGYRRADRGNCDRSPAPVGDTVT